MAQPKAQDVDVKLAQGINTCVLLDGYPAFAEFIARDRDAAIYRKFERLSARNLLYQQSELHDLERQLDCMDQQEAKDIDDQEARNAAADWTHFSTDTSRQAQSRRDLQGKIKLKLKEYRTCCGKSTHPTPTN